MNELLQKHGCSKVFSLPEGLKELMSDISREVLREQPAKINDFIANYLSVLLVTREHGILAVKILDDLCDCRPTISEHLVNLGFENAEAQSIAQVIQMEIESFEPIDGAEKLKETQMIKKILNKNLLDEDMIAKVCQIARNAYRDYWYRKKLLEQSLKEEPQEPWEIAAANTLELYKRTKPSFDELTRATERIQAAYRGYHVRKKLLKNLKPKKPGPKMEIVGPPLDIAASREIDLGPLVNLKVKEDEMVAMFETHTGLKLGLHYDPMKAITNVPDDDVSLEEDNRSDASESTGKQSTVDKSNNPHSRGQEFAKEVLCLDHNKEDDEAPEIEQRKSIKLQLSSTKSPVEIFSRHSRVHSVISPTGLNKKISFAEVPAEVIIASDDIADDVVEDVTDSHTDGEESAASLSSEPVTADISDAEEVDEETFE